MSWNCGELFSPKKGLAKNSALTCFRTFLMYRFSHRHHGRSRLCPRDENRARARLDSHRCRRPRRRHHRRRRRFRRSPGLLPLPFPGPEVVGDDPQIRVHRHHLGPGRRNPNQLSVQKGFTAFFLPFELIRTRITLTLLDIKKDQLCFMFEPDRFFGPEASLSVEPNFDKPTKKPRPGPPPRHLDMIFF